MNIWETYYNSTYYNLYFNILKDKGMSSEAVDDLKSKYWIYIQRLKETIFNQELSAINNKEEFIEKLRDIFENKWQHHFKYPQIIPHFYSYIKCLDSLQCIHNDFINEEEKKRLTKIAYPESLTEYETEYMVDGKLIALMNPSLLCILRKLIVEDGVDPKKVVINCKNFYIGLLEMTNTEYKNIILKLWNQKSSTRSAGRRNLIKIQFPDKSEKLLNGLEAMKEIVLFYGFEDVERFKLQIRGENLLTRYIGLGQNAIYEEIEKNKYVLNKGTIKDKLNVMRTINRLRGNKLVIELE